MALFSKALKLLVENKVKVDNLIQAKYPLNEGLTAFKHAQQRGVLKVLLEMD